jgi:hypothetical protein
MVLTNIILNEISLNLLQKNLTKIFLFQSISSNFQFVLTSLRFCHNAVINACVNAP